MNKSRKSSNHEPIKHIGPIDIEKTRHHERRPGKDGQLGVYWETTSLNGHSANIGNPFYAYSRDSADYKYNSREETKDQYAAWLYRKAYYQNRNPQMLDALNSIAKKRKNFNFIQIQKSLGIAAKVGIDKPEVAKFLISLDDKQGNSRNHLLIEHYQNTKDIASAKTILDRINPNSYLVNEYFLASKLENSLLKKTNYFIKGLGFSIYTKWVLVAGGDTKIKDNNDFWRMVFSFTVALTATITFMRYFEINISTKYPYKIIGSK